MCVYDPTCVSQFNARIKLKIHIHYLRTTYRCRRMHTYLIQMVNQRWRAMNERGNFHYRLRLANISLANRRRSLHGANRIISHALCLLFLAHIGIGVERPKSMERISSVCLHLCAQLQSWYNCANISSIATHLRPPPLLADAMVWWRATLLWTEYVEIAIQKIH